MNAPTSATVPVSLVVPAYNAEATLERAVRSALAGTAVPAEIIVVDDASSDGTAALAARLGATVVSLPDNRGAGGARNAGIAAARFELIAFLDADDIWEADKLERQLAALERWPDAGFCFTEYDVEGEDGSRLVHREMHRESAYRGIRVRERVGDAVRFVDDALIAGLVKCMFIRQSSVVVRRAVLTVSGTYDERFRLAEDYDLFLRIASCTGAVAIETPLVRYVRRTGSLSADPLAEITSIDALWTMIEEHSERYAPLVRSLVSARRAATLCDGTLRALRFGRTADAVELGRKAVAVERSPRTLGTYMLAQAVNTRFGRGARSVARDVWRAAR